MHHAHLSHGVFWKTKPPQSSNSIFCSNRMIQPSTRHTHLFPLRALTQGSRVDKETDVPALPAAAWETGQGLPQYTRLSRCISGHCNFGKTQLLTQPAPSDAHMKVKRNTSASQAAGKISFLGFLCLSPWPYFYSQIIKKPQCCWGKSCSTQSINTEMAYTLESYTFSEKTQSQNSISAQ